MNVSPLINITAENPAKAVNVTLPDGAGGRVTLTMYVSGSNELLGVSDLSLLENWIAQQRSESQVRTIGRDDVTDETRRDIKFFSNSPCWFEGCEKIRAAYEAEVAKLDAAKCKPCEKGALIRKYLQILKDAQRV